MIGRKRSGKERTGQTQFSTKFAAKLIFMARLKPLCAVFFLFFLRSHPLCDQTGGFRCRLFLTLRITLMLMVVLLGYICQVHIMFILSSLGCHFAIWRVYHVDPIVCQVYFAKWSSLHSGSLFCHCFAISRNYHVDDIVCQVWYACHDDRVCQVCFAKRLSLHHRG